MGKPIHDPNKIPQGLADWIWSFLQVIDLMMVCFFGGVSTIEYIGLVFANTFHQ